MRHAYLVCYDIGDRKRWRLIHKIMLAYGDPLQLSVFLCRLSPVEYQQMRARLLEQVNRRQDAIAIADLGREETAGVETYGTVRWDRGRRIVV